MNERYKDINSVQKDLIKGLLSYGHLTDPRGHETRELLDVSFVLVSPRSRLLTLKRRRWNLPLALGELSWHCDGSDKAESLAYYAKQWGNFAEPSGNIKGSCYGKHALSSSAFTSSQWDKVKQLLIHDPMSRRAIVFFNLAENRLEPTAIDVACVSSLQFLIRNDRLHAFVNMRSNDIIWGLPYDVFLFSWLQEKMANELGVQLGEYHHSATSMHLYARHYALAEDLLGSSSLASCEMPIMEDCKYLAEFISSEHAIRSDQVYSMSTDSYWSDLQKVLVSFSERRKTNIDIKDLSFQHNAYASLLDNQYNK